MLTRQFFQLAVDRTLPADRIAEINNRIDEGFVLGSIRPKRFPQRDPLFLGSIVLALSS
jgi:hypothetical protein